MKACTQTLDYLRTFLHAAGVNVFDAEEYDWDVSSAVERAPSIASLCVVRLCIHQYYMNI